ncbi:Ldh family oxidoreductase [Aquincola tertiaricarbonis]|uniref:Ldh family oxidoreductase n=1 Tax=Aquincola tertiaricarbonis TaxID=391953 RepID=UPI00061529C6|nr:Ldh family oxidoreductase [Aquincola tertiaricarbonis]
MTRDTTIVHLPHTALRDWGRRCLQAAGVPADDARTVADSLVQTSLWGIDSHGIARLPHYLNRLHHGSIRARPAMRDTLTGPGTAQVAGDRGLGIVVAHHANRLAMRLARESGIGAVGVADSSHCGAIGLYTREAAQAGLVGIAFTHADRIAAPQGGHQPFFGTNPISVAFPRAGGEPVCLDMATTSIPWNRVMNARREGHAVSPDVAVDEQGRPSTDPHQIRALRPLGGTDYGHKGYGLALVIELLCGPLNGNPYGPFITPMYEQLDQPRELGAFFLAIDPMRFAGGPMLAATVAHMAQTLAAEPGSPRMPGDPELEKQAVRLQQGIPVEPGLQAEFRAWSERLGVAAPV